MGAPSGAGVEMTGTARRAAGCLGLTRVGGGSTRRAELARTGQRKPSGGHKNQPGSARPPLKTPRGAWSSSPRPPPGHAPRLLGGPPPRRAELG